MFVPSEWEPDVPQGDVSFVKRASKRKLPKTGITLTQPAAPSQNGNKLDNSQATPSKNLKKKPENPTNDSLQNLALSEQSTKSKKKRKKKNKNLSAPGTFVRNPFAATTAIPKDSHSTEQATKAAEEVASNRTNATTKETNVDKKSNKIKNEKSPKKPKKFKLSEETKTKLNQSLEKPDELLLTLKRNQLDKEVKTDDREDILFKDTGKKNLRQVLKSKEKLKKVLSNGLQRNSVKAGGNKLRERMMEKLKAAQFRYLNEKLYTSSGSEAQQLFQADPVAFQTYHEGYQQQLKKWPVNPLDVIVKSILKMPKNITIADMGCGEGVLSRRVPQAVRSFDLVSRAPHVEACDMARTPLLAASVDVAVYCLALMGTDLTQYLVEANRVLKQGGLLLIAEVESRFEDADAFAKDVSRLGFKLLKLDRSHGVFFFMEFRKMQPPPAKKAKQPRLVLKPCVYKRR